MVLFKGLVQFVGSGVGSKDVFKRLVQSVGSRVGSPVDAWVDSIFLAQGFAQPPLNWSVQRVGSKFCSQMVCSNAGSRLCSRVCSRISS